MTILILILLDKDSSGCKMSCGVTPQNLRVRKICFYFMLDGYTTGH